ncbi:hypothetical protein HN51_027456 [Arachis hypogaea]
MEGHEHLRSEPTDTESTKELTEDNYTNTLALRKHAEAQPADNNVELKKPGITFSEPMPKGSTMDPANSNNPKHNNVDKDTINEVVTSDGRIPEKSQHDGGGANDTAYEKRVRQEKRKDHLKKQYKKRDPLRELK